LKGEVFFRIRIAIPLPGNSDALKGLTTPEANASSFLCALKAGLLLPASLHRGRHTAR